MGCCVPRDEQFSITFTPKNATQNNRTQQLNNSRLQTFKAKRADTNANANQPNHDLANQIQVEEKKQAKEQLEKIGKQISPINNKKITFSNGFFNPNIEAKDVITAQLEPQFERKDKSSFLEKPSLLFTQGLNNINGNEVDISRFHDFVLSSSQNNNSLHFDINNINLIMNNEEDKEQTAQAKIGQVQEEFATYKKKILTSLNSKISGKKIQKLPSPIKEHNEFIYHQEDSNKQNVELQHMGHAKYSERTLNKEHILNKYQHVFGDVENNTSRSGRSYYESHNNRSHRKVDIEGDFTNLRNNSVMSTERATRNIVGNEEDNLKRRYNSSQMKNLVTAAPKESSKNYNFNSNLFIEEQKVRSSKEITDKK